MTRFMIRDTGINAMQLPVILQQIRNKHHQRQPKTVKSPPADARQQLAGEQTAVQPKDKSGLHGLYQDSRVLSIIAAKLAL